jgi:1,6-anhydro-N-acetylmuramate kinase
MSEEMPWLTDANYSFIAERERDLQAESNQLREILIRIIASADECDVPADGAGVPLVSIDHRLIVKAKELIK